MKGRGNQSTIFMLYSIISALLVVTTAATTVDEMTEFLDEWFKTRVAEGSLTKLQIYIHADFNTASQNQTVYQVAAAEITPQSPSTFGRILIIDNPITVGPDPGSQSLGRYQGTNAYSDFNEAAANMNMNMVFSWGDYNGSSIGIMGRQPVFEEVRILPVIGGTGVFRYAKGVLVASTLSTNPDAQTGVYMYVIYIVTPSSSVGSVQLA